MIVNQRRHKAWGQPVKCPSLGTWYFSVCLRTQTETSVDIRTPRSHIWPFSPPEHTCLALWKRRCGEVDLQDVLPGAEDRDALRVVSQLLGQTPLHINFSRGSCPPSLCPPLKVYIKFHLLWAPFCLHFPILPPPPLPKPSASPGTIPGLVPSYHQL